MRPRRSLVIVWMASRRRAGLVVRHHAHVGPQVTPGHLHAPPTRPCGSASEIVRATTSGRQGDAHNRGQREADDRQPLKPHEGERLVGHPVRRPCPSGSWEIAPRPRPLLRRGSRRRAVAAVTAGSTLGGRCCRSRAGSAGETPPPGHAAAVRSRAPHSPIARRCTTSPVQAQAGSRREDRPDRLWVEPNANTPMTRPSENTGAVAKARGRACLPLAWKTPRSVWRSVRERSKPAASSELPLEPPRIELPTGIVSSRQNRRGLRYRAAGASGTRTIPTTVSKYSRKGSAAFASGRRRRWGRRRACWRSSRMPRMNVGAGQRRAVADPLDGVGLQPSLAAAVSAARFVRSRFLEERWRRCRPSIAGEESPHRIAAMTRKPEQQPAGDRAAAWRWLEGVRRRRSCVVGLVAEAAPETGWPPPDRCRPPGPRTDPVIERLPFRPATATVRTGRAARRCGWLGAMSDCPSRPRYPA